MHVIRRYKEERPWVLALGIFSDSHLAHALVGRDRRTMSGPYRFSVESPDPTDKRQLDEWNETVLKQVVNARFAPAKNRPAYLSGWVAQLGRLQVGRVQSSGGISKRGLDLVNAADDDRFNLLLPMGRSDISTMQNGREVRTGQCGAALVRMDTVAEVQFHTPQDAFLIFLPKKEMLAGCRISMMPASPKLCGVDQRSK